MSDKYTGYALKFISGKYQGNIFPLMANKEIYIGRGADLDIVLVEDMVSRKHAKLITGDDYVILQDLGSTNGSFVNGERIRKVRLKEGDRILIGTSILKLVSYNLEDLDPSLLEGLNNQNAQAQNSPQSHPNHQLPPIPQSSNNEPNQFPPPLPPELGKENSLSPHLSEQSNQMMPTLSPEEVPPQGGQPDFQPPPLPSQQQLGGLDEPANPYSQSFSSLSPGEPQKELSPSLPPSLSSENLSHTPIDQSVSNLGQPVSANTRRNIQLPGQPSMTGDLSETPLSELLELFESSGRTGVIAVKSNGREGHIHLRNGKIISAVLDTTFDVSAHKAAYRILSWTEGEFAIYPPYDQEIVQEIDEQPSSLLQEALRQREQIKLYLSEFPHPPRKFQLNRPLQPKLSELRPQYLDVVQAVFNWENTEDILDSLPLSDVDIFKFLLFLTKQGYISVQ